MTEGTPDRRFELPREELQFTVEHNLRVLAAMVVRQELDELGTDADDETADLSSRALEHPSVIVDDVIDFDATEARVLAVRFPADPSDGETVLFAEGYLLTVNRDVKRVTKQSGPVRIMASLDGSTVMVEGLDALSDDELQAALVATHNAFLGTNRLDRAVRLALLEENLDWLGSENVEADQGMTVVQSAVRLMEAEEPGFDNDLKCWYVRSKGELAHLSEISLLDDKLMIHVVDRRHDKHLYLVFQRGEDGSFFPRHGPELLDPGLVADALLLFTPGNYELVSEDYYQRHNGAQAVEEVLGEEETDRSEKARRERESHARQPGTRDEIEDQYR
ncbi:MAG TPA: hypothetical protein VIF43_01140 [Patescibacteria group bacterium]|jgi:hypothetical protein